jgi:hypothetical protein
MGDRPVIRHDGARQGAGSHGLAQCTDLWSEQMRKILAAMTAAAAAALALPAAAPAASVTITGDDGNPLALTAGATASLRQMKTDVGVTLTGAEKRYSLSATGPAGAAMEAVCYSIPTTGNRMNYQGNGTYTITVTTYTSTTSTCSGAGTTSTYTVAINAGVALQQPPSKLLTRKPNDFTSIEYQIPITLNPGALSQEIRYANGGVLAADGSISGPSQ